MQQLLSAKRTTERTLRLNLTPNKTYSSTSRAAARPRLEVVALRLDVVAAEEDTTRDSGPRPVIATMATTAEAVAVAWEEEEEGEAEEAAVTVTSRPRRGTRTRADDAVLRCITRRTIITTTEEEEAEAVLVPVVPRPEVRLRRRRIGHGTRRRAAVVACEETRSRWDRRGESIRRAS